MNLITQFRFLTSNIDGEVITLKTFKYVVATYNEEYLPIDKFLTINKYIERNTDVHFLDPIGLQMIVVRKLNNIKQ